MPRLTLEYDMLDEQEEYETAVGGHKYRSILYTFDQLLRNIVKHGSVNGKEYTEDEQDLVDGLREELWELINEEHVDLG